MVFGQVITPQLILAHFTIHVFTLHDCYDDCGRRGSLDPADVGEQFMRETGGDLADARCRLHGDRSIQPTRPIDLRGRKEGIQLARRLVWAKLFHQDFKDAFIVHFPCTHSWWMMWSSFPLPRGTGMCTHAASPTTFHSGSTTYYNMIHHRAPGRRYAWTWGKFWLGTSIGTCSGRASLLPDRFFHLHPPTFYFSGNRTGSLETWVTEFRWAKLESCQLYRFPVISYPTLYIDILDWLLNWLCWGRKYTIYFFSRMACVHHILKEELARKPRYSHQCSFKCYISTSTTTPILELL